MSGKNGMTKSEKFEEDVEIDFEYDDSEEVLFRKNAENQNIDQDDVENEEVLKNNGNDLKEKSLEKDNYDDTIYDDKKTLKEKILGHKKIIIGVGAVALITIAIISLSVSKRDKTLNKKNKVDANNMIVKDENDSEDLETQIEKSEQEEQEENGENKVLTELEPYYEKNKDIVGWLKVDGTNIDYPVMQTIGDNEYYLTRDFDGNDSKNGTLFVDENSKVGEPNYNAIIYGHNMKDMSMFGSLKYYAKESFFENHKTITFNTLYDRCEYEVMAAFYAEILEVDDTSFKYYKFNYAENEERFNYFVENVKQMSEYDTGVEAKYGDQFITLTTCSSHTENGRFVVVARKSNN